MARRPVKMRLLAPLLLATGMASAQSLKVEPGPEVLDGQPLAVIAQGLQPGERVTLRAERWRSAGGIGGSLRLWRSQARLQADACGVLDLRSAAALSGSWTGVDARGPFWSGIL